MFAVPAPVRRKARLAGAQQWLAALPALVSSLAAQWGLTVGAVFGDSTEAVRVRTSSRESLHRPLPAEVIEHAIACAQRRIAAHDSTRACLVHGDVHEWNALRSGDGFALIDPDGLLAEPEYDLGVLMREDPVELLVDGSWERAHRLAAATACDAKAIWEWGVVERVSTGLLLTSIGLEPVAGEMLVAACEVTLNGR